MSAHTTEPFPHDENMQAFEHDGNILIAESMRPTEGLMKMIGSGTESNSGSPLSMNSVNGSRTATSVPAPIFPSLSRYSALQSPSPFGRRSPPHFSWGNR